MKRFPKSSGRASDGFSRPDLVATLAACCLLTGLALPLLRAGMVQQTVACVDHLRSLGLAWQLYAQDNGERLVNNYGVSDTMATVNAKTYRTWALNVLDWSTDRANTNRLLIENSRLYPYLGGDPSAFKCDADTYLSTVQRRAGWSERVRSYSMNAFLGRTTATPNASDANGVNLYFPEYRQFLLTSSIPNPAETVVFLDEHPDSINDGLFLNNPNVATQWGDIPGSQHDGGAGISFADGSALIRRWSFPSSQKPVRYAFPFNLNIPAGEREDYRWLARRLSVVHATLGITQSEDQLRFIWSQTPPNLVLQTSPGLTPAAWTDLKITPQRGLGQSVVTLPAPSESTVYRLLRR
ncbi:MAG: hypothetical protein JNL10_19355 [Verrucomicrobiales bacterium]|nr:hypothetical protein [Verrucomicrobiales bacterium]